MIFTEKKKEKLLRKDLGKCEKCPFLKVLDVENKKVYCFYRLGKECLIFKK